ncbi:unnamed protein product [Diabrotica balteata]|uniref:Uncharacterized protein n=1 Tax=Diabrotica balteata TaxID=107213 RepID=A0A9N9X9M9_DIABA|nr:unnamed protein product [Diabrotica balteata]
MKASKREQFYISSEEVKRRIHIGNKTCNCIKCKIYKTLIKPVLVYGSETWTLSKSDENLLGTFERKILRHIYKGVKETDIWRRRYNFELCTAYNEPEIVTSINIGRLRWMGHIEQMLETETPKHIIRQTLVGGRSKGRPKLRYIEQVKQDLKTLKITNWKNKAKNRTE